MWASWRRRSSLRRLSPLPEGRLSGTLRSSAVWSSGSSLRELLSGSFPAGVRRGLAVALAVPLVLLLAMPAGGVVLPKGATRSQMQEYQSLSSKEGRTCEAFLNGSGSLSLSSPVAKVWAAGVREQAVCSSTQLQAWTLWRMVLADSTVSEITGTVSAPGVTPGPQLYVNSTIGLCLVLFLLAVIVGLLLSAR